MDDSDCEYDSLMEWTPAKPDPAFNPYLDNYYVPGGWPADPPPRTAGVFARPQPEGFFLPKAKKLCYGIAIAGMVVASAVAVPVYSIVRQVRQQQQRRRARPLRHSQTPTQSRSTQPRALLTDSPWHRANTYYSTQATATQSRLILPNRAQVTDLETELALVPITAYKPRPRPTRPTPRTHPTRHAQNCTKILYTIPDLMPKGTVRKRKSPVGTKRKHERILPIVASQQETDIGLQTQPAIDGIYTSSNPSVVKRRQVSPPTPTDRGIMLPSTDSRHGPPDRPGFPSLSTFKSMFTRTESANSNTQPQDDPKGSNPTAPHSNLSLQQTDTAATVALNSSPSTSPRPLVEDVQATNSLIASTLYTFLPLVDDIKATPAPNTSSSVSPQQQIDTTSINALKPSHSDTSQQLVDDIKATKALTTRPILQAPPKSVVSKSPNPTPSEYLTPPHIRHRRVEALSSSRRSQRDSLRTQTPESEISSTCPFSPGNPGWDLPELNGLQPSNQIQNQAQTQTQTPESDISSTYPLSPGNPGNPPQDINNTMQEPTHRHQSPLPASSPHHSDFITSLSYTRVTGGGSPLPGRRSSLDLGRDFIPASTSIDHPSLSTSPGLSPANDNVPQEAGTEDAAVVEQPTSDLDPTSPPNKPEETQNEGSETQHSDPETPQSNNISDGLELHDILKSPQPSDSVTQSDSPITIPSTPSPKIPGKNHLDRESDLTDPAKEQAQLTGSPPELKLAELTLDDEFNPNAATPKASPHSDARGHRVTRAEAKRLQLLEEIQRYSIGPLGEEWEGRIQTALRSGHGSYKATDLTRVVPLVAGRGTDNWLNDEVINGYLKLVVAHGKQNDRPTQIPTHHAFVSFFYTNLASKGYDSVKKWASRAKIGGKNLLETDQVFIPINSGMHWTICVVSGKEKTITHYNSMGGNGQGYVNTVKNWVKEELGSSFVESEWALRARGESPQQTNMDDCGVFTITSARQIMLGMTPTSYNAGQIPLQRRRIVAELINGGLIKSNEHDE